MTIGEYQQAPQARFQVVGQPGALPGSCLFCGGIPTDERSFFIDPNVAMEWHGAIYICKLCLFEMASTVGWAEPSTVKTLMARIAALETETYQQAVQLAAYNELRKSIAVLGVGLNSVREFAGVDINGLLAQGPPVDAQLSFGLDARGERVAPDGGADLGEGARASDEPGDDEGVDIVRTDGGGTPDWFAL